MATGKKGAGGFTYLGLLLFIAIAGIGLAVVGKVWHTEAQREREKELLFIGEQYANAIGSYYENTPGGIKQYPSTLQDLLLDNRLPDIRRHLRKIYPDPITGSLEWGLIKNQGRITGVYSQSLARPLKNHGFPEARASFENASKYSDWQFAYNPVGQTGTQPLLQTASLTPGVQPADGNHSSSPSDAALGQSEGQDAVDEENKAGASASPDSKAAEPEPDSSLSKKLVCLAQRTNDIVACNAYCDATKKENETASPECFRCQSTITSRYLACLNGTGLPVLHDGH